MSARAGGSGNVALLTFFYISGRISMKSNSALIVKWNRVFSFSDKNVLKHQGCQAVQCSLMGYQCKNYFIAYLFVVKGDYKITRFKLYCHCKN